MKNRFLYLFARNFGTIVRWLTGFIVAGIIAILARFGLQISEETTIQIIAFVAPLVAGTLGEFVVAWQGKSIEEIQAALKPLDNQIEVDKWAGPQTIATVKNVADKLEEFRAEKAIRFPSDPS